MLRHQYLTQKTTPTAIMARHIAAAQELGTTLNAFTQVLDATAMREAHASTMRYRMGQPLSALDGIPVSVKDLLHVAGTPTGAGSRAYSSAVQDRDAALVTQLRQAGAIIMGKTNLLEFAFGLVHPALGPVHNPWDLTLTMGGSSSGAAAAVAAGIGVVAVGTDTAGSIRNPAALGGVVGFKPSYGFYSPEGLIPLSPSLDHLGWIAPTVADIRTVTETLGLVPRDPGDRPHVVVADLGFTQPDVRDLTQRLVTAMSAIADVQDGFVFAWDQANAAALVLITAEAYAVHRDWLRTRWANYSVGTRARLLAGSRITTAEYLRARQVRAWLQAEWLRRTVDWDFVVLPTLPSVAQPESRTGDEELASATLYTSTFALLGLPAISVPSGLTPANRPAGLQIVGRPGHDAELLAFAAQVEAIRGPLPRPPHYAYIID